MKRRRPALSVVALAAGLGFLALLAAGCGSNPSWPGVATSSTTSNAASPSTSGGNQATGLVAYASCMRSNGVPNFPDPTASGGIPKEGVISAEGAVSNSQVRTAQNACENLLPAGGSLSGKTGQPVTTQDRQDYLKAAACMRSHGTANFPDPTFLGAQVEFPGLSQLVDSHSSQFVQALHICQKLIPPGLPDSGSEG
jgi:hypothetical protein